MQTPTRRRRLIVALLITLSMLGLNLSQAAAQEADELTDEQMEQFLTDDVTMDFGGSGGGGEPIDPPTPAPAPADGEEGVDVSAASLQTRTLVRTKKIPAAAFSGRDLNFTAGGSCVYPADGNSAIYAAVTGLPQGAVVTRFLAEGFDDPGESENFTVALRWGDGDGASGAMASGTSAGGGYTNVEDTTIANATINGLGAAGRTYFVAFDPDNNAFPDFDLNDHRICSVWITYEVTETYLSDVMQIEPVVPCAEFDTRPGLPGNGVDGGFLTAGETRTISMTAGGTANDCGVPVAADGFVVSAFLINRSGVNWLNIYDSTLPDNDEAVLVGTPTDALESVSLLVPDGTFNKDVKLTLGGTAGATADVKLVITGYYYLNDQPINRYAD